MKAGRSRPTTLHPRLKNDVSQLQNKSGVKKSSGNLSFSLTSLPSSLHCVPFQTARFCLLTPVTSCIISMVSEMFCACAVVVSFQVPKQGLKQCCCCFTPNNLNLTILQQNRFDGVFGYCCTHFSCFLSFVQYGSDCTV